MDAVQFERGVALLDSGKVESALREFETLAAAESDAGEKSSLLLNQVACLMRIGRLGEARDRLSEAAAYCSNLYTQYFDLSLCAAEGRAEEASSKLAEFLKMRKELASSGDEGLCSDAAEKV